MTARRVDHELDRAAWRLQRASNTVPEVLVHLQEQLLFATFGASDSEAGRVAGGDMSDPTYQAMSRRDPVVALERRVYAARKAISDAIDELDDACRAALGMRVAQAEQTPTCDGGDPSSWGDPTCGQYVEHYTREDGSTGFRAEGLCARHRKRRQRYLSGLEPEEAA